MDKIRATLAVVTYVAVLTACTIYIGGETKAFFNGGQAIAAPIK